MVRACFARFDAPNIYALTPVRRRALASRPVVLELGLQIGPYSILKMTSVAYDTHQESAHLSRTRANPRHEPDGCPTIESKHVRGPSRDGKNDTKQS